MSVTTFTARTGSAGGGALSQATRRTDASARLRPSRAVGVDGVRMGSEGVKLLMTDRLVI